MTKAGKCRFKKVALAINPEEKSPGSSQRILMNMMNALFCVFPKLEEKLTRVQATQLLTMMDVSGMFMFDDGNYNSSNKEDRIDYATVMIEYELGIRAIARFLGISEDIASQFIRCCFRANKANDIYPYAKTISSCAREYTLLIKAFGNDIARLIASMITGQSIEDDISFRFPIFKRIAKNIANLSSAKMFILKGCDYVATHPDSSRESQLGQSELIFIDEFIDYLREMDKNIYLHFQDEISSLLSNIDVPFARNCTYIGEHLQMSTYGQDTKAIQDEFDKFLRSESDVDDGDDKTLDMFGKNQDQIPDTPPTTTIPLPRIALPGGLPLLPSPMIAFPQPTISVSSNANKSKKRSDSDDDHDGDGYSKNDGNYRNNGNGYLTDDE